MTRMDDIDDSEGETPVWGSIPASPPNDGRGRRLRRNVVAVGAAMGLTLGGLGIAAAQTASNDSSTTGSSSTTAPAAPAAGAPAPAAATDHGGPGHGPGPGLAAAGKAIGISEADLATALRSGQSIAQVAQSKNVDVKTVIAAMVADAKAKAEERAATLEQRVTDAVNQAGGPVGRGGPGGPGRPGHGPGLAAAAKAIGVSEADLATALRSGQSIAQVAQSKNVDVKAVISAMVDEAKARLAADVQAGRLTQAQADEKAASLEQKITDAVNRTGGGPGRRGPAGP